MCTTVPFVGGMNARNWGHTTSARHDVDRFENKHSHQSLERRWRGRHTLSKNMHAARTKCASISRNLAGIIEAPPTRPIVAQTSPHASPPETLLDPSNIKRFKHFDSFFVKKVALGCAGGDGARGGYDVGVGLHQLPGWVSVVERLRRPTMQLAWRTASVFFLFGKESSRCILSISFVAVITLILLAPAPLFHQQKRSLLWWICQDESFPSMQHRTL